MFTNLMIGLVVVVAAPDAKEAAKKDGPSIVGEWKLEKTVRRGKEFSADGQVAIFRFNSDGSLSMSFAGVEIKDQATFTVDATKSPAQMDVTNKLKKEKTLSIYKIDGDTLVTCSADEGAARPTEFTSTAENKTELMTFKRVK